MAQAIPGSRSAAAGAWARDYDLWLVGAALLLLGLGLVMVASASITTADRELDQPLYYFERQTLYALFGMVLAWAALRLPLGLWRAQSVILLLLAFGLLVLVLVPGVGREVNGSTRWIRLAGFSFQPSELLKLAMVVYLAGYLVRRADDVRSLFRGFLRPVILLALAAGLLLLEPDYGTTVVLFATALGMLFLGGVPLLRFSGWLAIIGSMLGAIILTAPYRLERFAGFLDPWADPFGSGFQLTQALIAIGRGEWFGVGLGASIQKLFYLPEAHTDFLFAVLAEELGFVGAALVICLYGFLVWRSLAIGGRAEAAGHHFGAHVAYGVGLLIGLQAIINIGVNMGVLPTKGLTLPLMSYGGSSVVVHCLAIGLVLRVDHETRTEGPVREQ